MESAEHNQQSPWKITNLVNRQCNIQNQQSRLQIFTQENEKNVKQKLKDEWIIQTTQSKLKEVETVQEAQKATIQEFQMKYKQLEMNLSEELEMRTVVMNKMTKMQKAMSLYVELYTIIKNNFKSCETARTKLNNLYDSLLQDNAEVKRYNATMTKKFEDHVNELTTEIAQMKKRFTKAVHENVKLDLRNEGALLSMKHTINMLKKRLAEFTQKNTNLLSELSEAISQKESLINDFTKLEGNHESSQAQLNENTPEYNTKVANLNQIKEDNKESYEKLEGKSNNLLAAFDHQNDRHQSISHANRAQKATIASNLPRKFRAWDESDSDSSWDRKITDLKRRTTDIFRIIPSKRPSSPSSACEQGSSPKHSKMNIISQERLDKLFDTLHVKIFGKPAEKKSLRSRKPHSRKPVF